MKTVASNTTRILALIAALSAGSGAKANPQSLLQTNSPTNGPTDSVANEYSESPYFIDGLHCEGFETDQRAFSGDDGARTRANRILSQSYCDGLFKMYGIQKFNWYTPEQLEYVQIALRKAADFEAQDIAIKKGSQVGHVHLFVKIKLPSENTYRANYSLEVFDGKKGSAATAQNLQLGLTLPSKSANANQWKFATELYELKANSPMPEKAEWSDQEKNLNQYPHIINHQIHWGFEQKIPMGPLGFDFDFSSITHNITQNRKLDFDTAASFGLFFRQAAERSQTKLGILFDKMSSTPFETTAAKSTNRTNRLGFLFDLNAGDPENSFLKARVHLLTPNGSKDSGMVATSLNLGFDAKQFIDQWDFNFSRACPSFS